MADIKNKIELSDLLELMVTQFETLFATNNNGELSATKLREYMQTQIDYLTILNGSLKLQRMEFIPLDDVSETILPDGVDENILYIHNNVAPQVVNLPPLTAENDGISIRGVLLTVNDTTFTPDGLDNFIGTNPEHDSLYKLTSVFVKQAWIAEYKALV